MALTAEQIIDLLTTTQRDLGKLRWTDIATDLQEYIALPQILQKKKVRFGSGIGIQWNVMTGNSGAAKNVGLYAVDDVNVGDIMQTANIPWRHTTTNYAFERREIAMNRQPARIVELVKTRRVDAMLSLAGLCEENLWGKPADSSDDVTPYGVKYWIVPNTSEGFNGGNPAGFAAGAAGLDSTAYARWRNWTAQYTAITKEDLIRKWRKAFRFCQFRSPVPQPNYLPGTQGQYGFYSNYDVVGTMEEILENQNDNLGNDVASKDGKTVFRGIAVTWAPFLEDESTDPVIGINWGTFKPVFLDGEYMREEAPRQAPNQHTVFEVHVDLTANYECRDRRRNFWLSK